jgi:hypothetical protein
LSKVAITRADEDLCTAVTKAVRDLGERGMKLQKPLTICLGKNPDLSENRAWLLVGDCAEVKNRGRGNWVDGCPPA